MVLYLVDVPPAVDDKVRALIGEGRYRTTAHATEAALDLLLQLHAMPAEIQRSVVNGSLAGAGAASTPGLPTGKSNVNVVSPPRFAPPSRPTQLPPDDRLLWAVPRLFPMKLAARVLAQLLVAAGTDNVPFSAWTQTLRPEATEQSRRLSAMDISAARKFGEHFAAGLPTPDAKDPAASWARFVVQYLYGPKRNGGAEGAMARLGLIWVDETSSSEPVVGLTPLGSELALAPSPVLDTTGEVDALLSEEERAIFQRAFEGHPESGHMRAFLTSVLGGSRTPRDVMPALCKFYEEAISSTHITEGYASSLRGGVVSRLRELGAIEVERDGNQVSYSITPRGRSYLKTLEA